MDPISRLDMVSAGLVIVLVITFVGSFFGGVVLGDSAWYTVFKIYMYALGVWILLVAIQQIPKIIRGQVKVTYGWRDMLRDILIIVFVLGVLHIFDFLQGVLR